MILTILSFYFSQQGGAIQRSAKAKDIAYFASNITEGDYLEIKSFYTYENRYVNTVANHDTIIDFKKLTAKSLTSILLLLLFLDIILIYLILPCPS
jgi:hypothetical protein